MLTFFFEIMNIGLQRVMYDTVILTLTSAVLYIAMRFTVGTIIARPRMTNGQPYYYNTA